MCHSRCNKHGRTSSNRQRWRCTHCGFSFVRSNEQAEYAKWFRIFISWLTTGRSLADTAATHNTSTSTLKRKFTTFWLVQPPRPVDPHRVYTQIFLDGTYINSSCLLVASDINHVINWFWCHTESEWSYGRLLDTMAPADIATVNGHNGALKAITTQWSDTKVQRCLVHVQRNITEATGRKPQTPMGKALRRLGLDLLKVRTEKQAADWVLKLHKFNYLFSNKLKERTYVKDVPFEQIPKSKRKTKSGGTPTTDTARPTTCWKSWSTTTTSSCSSPNHTSNPTRTTRQPSNAPPTVWKAGLTRR